MNPNPQQPTQGGGMGQQAARGAIGQAHDMAQQQINRAIDDFANKIPGGQQYSQQAKDAVSEILNTLENAAEQQAGGMFGGPSSGSQNPRI